MRMETLDAAMAFIHGGEYSSKRTRVIKGQMFLHSYCIAVMEANDEIWFSMRGFPTNLTLERLNGICELMWNKRPFFKRNGKVYFETLLREVGDQEVIRLPRKLPSEVT